MKKSQKGFVVPILIAVIAFVVFAGGAYVYLQNNKHTNTYTEKKTEEVFCSTTVPSHCYLYRCDTGYIYAIDTPAPGSNPLRCTDGSEIKNIKEI